MPGLFAQPPLSQQPWAAVEIPPAMAKPTPGFCVCILRSLGPSLACIKIQNDNYSVAAPEVLHPHPTTQEHQREKQS